MRNLLIFSFLFICYSVFPQSKIQYKAIKYITQKVGKPFYDKYISFNEKYSKKNILLFNFTIQQSPNITKLLVININKKMEIDSINCNIDIKQLKKCIEKPDKCELPMTEVTAIEIAQRNNLGQNISQWDIKFLPFGTIKNNYMWEIKKYKYKSPPNSGAYIANGICISIDAITGKTVISDFSEKE